MVDNRELHRVLDEEDAELEEDTMDTGVERGRDTEVGKDAVEDAQELAKEITDLVEHPTPENKSALARIAEILSVPLGRLMKMFAREQSSVETGEIPAAVREKMVQLEIQPAEQDLRGAVLSLLRELRGLKPAGQEDPEKLIAMLEGEKFGKFEAGVVRKQLSEAMKQFDPEKNDKERMALYDQLDRFTRALFRYHDLDPKKVTVPFAEEHPGAYAHGLMDLGVDPGKAVQEGQKRYDQWERAKRKHDEANRVPDVAAKWRYTLEALDAKLDFAPPKQEEEKREPIKKAV